MRSILIFVAIMLSKEKPVVLPGLAEADQFTSYTG